MVESIDQFAHGFRLKASVLRIRSKAFVQARKSTNRVLHAGQAQSPESFRTLIKLPYLELFPISRWIFFLAFALANSALTETLLAQTVSNPAITHFSPSIAPIPVLDEQQRRLRAASELRDEEHQRILGVMPNFNTSEIQEAQPLSPGQKFSLAVKSSFDPFTFVATGLDAGLSQVEHAFPGYRQGGLGYSRRFGAAYADGLNSTIIGNALLPVLFKQDPRYFRKGSGSFGGRLIYALMSAVQCKDDNGRWEPNYSNVLGTLAAGGISNLYYPSSDRGATLTLERATDVTVEGAIGSVFFEFWPDISHKFLSKHRGNKLR